MLRRVVHLAGVLAMVSSLGGGGSSTSPTGTATPTPGPNTVALGSVAPLAPQFFAIPVSPPTPGPPTLQVNWTSPTAVRLVGLAPSTGTVPAYVRAACPFLRVDGNATTTAIKTVTAAAQPADSYVVIIDNQGPGNESVSYTLTRS